MTDKEYLQFVELLAKVVDDCGLDRIELYTKAKDLLDFINEN